ncbi:histidinol dehydrogenase [Carboxylicivirga sp. M1479]|uniref:histidinol dehydrogenase n=1 Tax=Carboxylicivirga sp. M1479 TaxID=2594476 RepID=UPI00117821D1|nr:histidinol dehydrogenase [Carboxylicivirga sp. M1479]TRX72347.1 histidinol dehydrogenase [Carboxylicivirga sp. M1479]
MQKILYPPKNQWSQLLERPDNGLEDVYDTARGVLDDVQRNGDAALIKYTSIFDGVQLSQLQVSQEEVDEACMQVSCNLKDAILVAKKNIEIFHQAQKQQREVVETMPGVQCWQKSVAIEKVGLYIPGGTAPLFSTVLMLGIPAQIAGCKEVVLCTPANKEGKVDPAILYAASLVEVSRIYKLGGIQAIGAMAYGTETVPSVAKIFGPGNRFVTAAKQLVSLKDVAIDMPAGPSEVMVMADESADAAFIASDLLSQAEHGADSQVIFVTNNENMLREVEEEVEKQLEELPRKEIAKKALDNSRLIVLNDADEMLDMCNQYAPEHLIISMRDDELIGNKVVNAGSVFLGNYSPESAGDYASGTNHTLPTHGYANAFSGVNLDSYMKKITFQKISAFGLAKLGPSIEIMAEAEQLMAHKNAVTVRLKKMNV